MKMHPSFAAILIAMVLLPSRHVRAQSDEIAELKAMVQAMQKTISEQNQRIAALEKQQHEQEQKLATRVESPGGIPRQASADIQTPQVTAAEIAKARSVIRDMDTFLDEQRAAPRANNAPIDPAMKGFIPIPGTETVFKIGGSARIDGITDFGNNGNPNMFVPSTIPVPGEPGAGGDTRSTLHTKGTRLSLELRRPLPGEDSLRIFSEFDFFDDSTSSSMKFRPRHFYGQASNILIGQTFTAFMDIDAFPDVVDYQGPNGIVNRRLPQIRYTHPVIDEEERKFLLFASIEQPDLSIDTDNDEFAEDSSTVTHIPDGVLGMRYETTTGHAQVATLLRDLSYESDGGADGSVFGWGVSLSGAVNVGDKDKLFLQATYGEGISRYINDLSGEDLDAAIDHGSLQAIPVFATMAGYTHHWNEHWRSTLSAGYVNVDAPGSLGGFAIDTTTYSSVNLMWHPTKTFRMGLEYLYGNKDTQGGGEADAHRVNFVLRYDLVR